METIFWNVDTQYDFMRNDKGALPVPGAKEIERNLEKLTHIAKIKRLKVINTADWHKRNSEELSDNPDFKKTFPPHCLEYTRGAEFIPITSPVNPYKVHWEDNELDLDEIREERNIVIYKDKFDVFSGNYKTEKILEAINPDRAVVYGVATNVCVDFAVKGLLKKGIKVYIPTDAIKELPNLPLPFNNWRKLGAKLTKTKDIGKILEEKPIPSKI